MPPGRTFEQPVPRGHTALAYLFQGDAAFGVDEFGSGTELSATRLAVFGDGDVVAVRTGQGPARFLLLSGQPLSEPLARYGPFVMNTSEEIDLALRELRAGTFVKR
jgi:hypothetical protein